MSADTTTTEAPVTDGILLTEVAAAKVKALLESEGREDLSLRVAVQPGGCSGLRYQLFFDDRETLLQAGNLGLQCADVFSR